MLRQSYHVIENNWKERKETGEESSMEEALASQSSSSNFPGCHSFFFP